MLYIYTILIYISQHVFIIVIIIDFPSYYGNFLTNLELSPVNVNRVALRHMGLALSGEMLVCNNDPLIYTFHTPIFFCNLCDSSFEQLRI